MGQIGKLTKQNFFSLKDVIISQAYQLQAQKSSQFLNIFIILKNLIISMKNTTLSIQKNGPCKKCENINT